MRRVAGILMIMYGVKTIVFRFVVPLIRWNFPYALGLEEDLIVVISAAFIVTGGVFCLKRKYWKLCFASSLVLLLFLMFELVFIFPLAFGFNYFLLPQFIDMIISLPWGILPLIFVCLRKSEWNIYSGTDFNHLKVTRMRIAIGILMLMYGVRMIVFAGGLWSEQGIEGLDFALFVGLVAIILAVYIITGGVFCLKRKYWKTCFASSLVLLLFFMFFELFLFEPSTSWLNLPFWVVIPLSIPWAILPQIFVCIRKSEWQEISA